MRFGGNFYPEWGYLAPAPSFMRTARVAVIATAIGAVAGAGVVLSLSDRPAETSVAARTLVRPVEAVALAPIGGSSTPLAQAPSEKRPAAPAPAAIAALVEAPAASDDALARAEAELKATPTPQPVAAAWALRKKAKVKRSISRDSARGDSWRNDTRRGRPLAIVPGEYAMRGASRWADRDAWGAYDPER